MDPNLIIDALIFAALTFAKQQGLSIEEAKARFHAKADEMEATPDLPMADKG